MEQRLIDANALIEEFEYYIREAGWNDDWNRCLKDVAIECIKNAQTIEAEPVKHGKWIKKTWYSRGGYRYLKCDCGKEHCIEKPIDDIVDICSECGKINEASFRNYCPNCGARMDGE